MAVHLNSFVRRQTPDSSESHFIHTWEELVARVRYNLNKARPGYRDGVLLVPVDPEGFFSGVVVLQEGDKLQGEYKARRPGETPRKKITTVGKDKRPAAEVFVVLYASTVLAEGGDNELAAEDGNWEIISLNASPVEGEMPINPMVLMHNHFGSDGGTATGLSDSEFVALLRKGFNFWKDKAMCG